MATPIRSLILGVMMLAATSFAAAAQYPYPYAPQYPYPYAPPSYPYAPPPYSPVPAISPAQAYPPSWSYDPYTSGAAPCPQGIPGELGKCRDRMPPTYGQPSYWPQR